MAERAARLRHETSPRRRARLFDAPPARDAALRLVEEIVATVPAPSAETIRKPIALYGAGNLGQMAREFLAEVGCDFDFVVDRDAERLRAHPLWRDKPVYAPDAVPQALRSSHQLLVTVVTAPYVALETMLVDLGFRHVAPFYDFAEQFRDVHSLSNGWRAAPLTEADGEAAAHVIAGFADDISRALHLQFLAWRVLREEWIFGGTDVFNGNRFFIPEVMVALRPDPVFIDGGAHHGSVAFELDRLRPAWRAIAAFEPDAANRAVLEAEFAARWPASAGRSATISAEALGAAPGRGRFHAGLGYASQLSAIGGETVEVVPLDGLDLAPDFVKLHLEGGEFDALTGGREMFQRARPIVAATVYHNADGIARTPRLLMETMEDYDILFRTHSWCGTGAVVYAIPRELRR